ncbi:cytochrome d ubiquinol oxidase subunit II, partial [Escherichia coli]|nr:cytochrome d ubiquinol oxidase subunit II [Escherichia coli]
LVYSVILDALAMPLTIMLVALIFRGVAFEFRFKADDTHKVFWDNAFIVGSLLTTFMQGIVVGSIVQGLPIIDRTFAGSYFDWLSPFALFCGFGLVIAYSLLGCGWLIMKTQGHLQQSLYKVILPLTFVMLAVIAVVSLWTPLAQPAIAERWFSLPNIFFFLPVPLLVLYSAWLIIRAVKKKDHYLPFFASLAIIFLGFTGLGISIWPNIIPPAISFIDASAPPESQGFMLVGALFIIPIILVYTFWSYYVFRGKTNYEEGYH